MNMDIMLGLNLYDSYCNVSLKYRSIIYASYYETIYIASCHIPYQIGNFAFKLER